ncbi:peptidylprolyl isomerase [Bacteroidota bacterium]
MTKAFFIGIFLFFTGFLAAQQLPDTTILQLIAPESFQAVFATTKGKFVLEATRSWSPAGVDRLYQLLTTHFYDSNCLFRVQKGYVVQFGICDRPEVNRFWDRHPIPDEPVVAQNLKGTISYARDGVDTRTAQLFVNCNDNYKLDTIDFNGLRGFPPIARIVSGYEVIEKLFSDFGFEPANHQDSVMIYGNDYLKQVFPGLDYIITGRLIME